MSEPLRQRSSPLSSTPMSSSSSFTPPPPPTPEQNNTTASSPPLPTPPTTTFKSTSSSTSTSTSLPTQSTTARHRPIKPINTHRANNKRTHTSSLSSAASRTPRSPFGAWTGSPRTPLAPHFARQAPAQVLALLVLGVVALGVLGWVVVVGQSRGGEWEGEGEVLLEQHGAGGPELLTEIGGWRGSGPKRIVPDFPLTTLAVADHAEFQDGGEVGHEAWMRMFPEGNGQVRVDEPRKWGLPRSERLVDGQGRYVGEAEVFEVAVVRELECLLVVRDVLMRWEEGAGESGGLQEWEGRDARRCLDHLRQAILCHADTTLERVGQGQGRPWQSRAHSPNEIPHVDMDGSVGTVRTCKDWDHVRRWLEENRADRDSDHRDL